MGSRVTQKDKVRILPGDEGRKQRRVGWRNGASEVVKSERTVRRGDDPRGACREEAVPPEIAAELAMHTAEDQLTERELEILELIAKGNANKEIAAQLSIREDTVKSHVGNILEKLDANDPRAPSRSGSSVESSSCKSPKSGVRPLRYLMFQTGCHSRKLRSGYMCNGCSPRSRAARRASGF